MSTPQPALTDIRAHDGSRQFLALPETVSAEKLRHCIRALKARTTGFLDAPAEIWIDFRFAGHDFTINRQNGEYWFFVADPDCPETILHSVAEHFYPYLNAS